MLLNHSSAAHTTCRLVNVGALLSEKRTRMLETQPIVINKRTRGWTA